jgi:hypothetical protein
MCTATFMNKHVREHSTHKFKKIMTPYNFNADIPITQAKVRTVKYFNTLNSSGAFWLRHSYDFDVLGHGWSLCVTASIEIPSIVDGLQQLMSSKKCGFKSPCFCYCNLTHARRKTL